MPVSLVKTKPASVLVDHTRQLRSADLFTDAVTGRDWVVLSMTPTAYSIVHADGTGPGLGNLHHVLHRPVRVNRPRVW